MPNDVFIARTNADILTAQTGETISRACEVYVYLGGPAEAQVVGAEVEFLVEQGAAVFSNNSDSIVLLTGANGRAATDLKINEGGSIIVAARLVGAMDDDDSVEFLIHTEKDTHKIQISAPQHVVAGEAFSVSATLTNHHGRPIDDAELELSAGSFPDLAVSGDIQHVGDGRYEGNLTITEAGQWSVVVLDQSAFEQIYWNIGVLPGPAAAIDIQGPLDPRVTEPYDRTTLDIRVVDSFGNTVASSGVSVSVDGRPVKTQLGERYATVSIPALSLGDQALTISDANSGISREEIIACSPISMGNPGYVTLGSDFAIPIYLYVPKEKAGRPGKITISFDPKRAAYRGFTLSEAAEALVTITQNSVDDKKFVLEFDPLANRQEKKYKNGGGWPEEFCIGQTEWSCLSEGETCFGASLAMSPEWGPWDLCIKQKQAIVRPVCLKFIYPPTRSGGRYRDIVKRNLPAVEEIFNSIQALAACCPQISISADHCFMGSGEWKQVKKTSSMVFKMESGISASVTPKAGAIGSVGQFRHIANMPLRCYSDNCINIVMMPFNKESRNRGYALRGEGHAAIDPSELATNSNVLPHEIAHTLGLEDAKNKDQLMTYDSGTNILPGECQTIWSYINNYPGG